MTNLLLSKIRIILMTTDKEKCRDGFWFKVISFYDNFLLTVKKS